MTRNDVVSLAVLLVMALFFMWLLCEATSFGAIEHKRARLEKGLPVLDAPPDSEFNRVFFCPLRNWGYSCKPR